MKRLGKANNCEIDQLEETIGVQVIPKKENPLEESIPTEINEGTESVNPENSEEVKISIESTKEVLDSDISSEKEEKTAFSIETHQPELKIEVRG
ncbi:hypothetical protein [Enterococcus sp. 5B3_DIV0040]|uniref:hypothetical protein n=1 Tax=Enterococcus sp. 5B3_DIV0040 TaxID=1834182 RepID=UPI000A353722|nr:hypothetical protein [Enterococcus sp. 5B3_DIV0040]OTO01218.1 hypothetical protein A5883_003535 [Enterococcus sp. 5B3_DIV0040]